LLIVVLKHFCVKLPGQQAKADNLPGNFSAGQFCLASNKWTWGVCARWAIRGRNARVHRWKWWVSVVGKITMGEEISKETVDALEGYFSCPLPAACFSVCMKEEGLVI